MLSITDRDSLVSTIDALAKGGEDETSVVELLQRLRRSRAVAWCILLADCTHLEHDDKQPRQQLQAHALVELTFGSQRLRHMAKAEGSEGMQAVIQLAVVEALKALLVVALGDHLPSEDGSSGPYSY